MTTPHKQLLQELRDFIVTHDDEGLIAHSDMIQRVDAELSKAPIEGKPEGWKHEIDSFDGQGYSCLKTIVCAHPKPSWFDGHEVTKIIKSTPLYTTPPTQALATPTQGEDLSDEEIAVIYKHTFESQLGCARTAPTCPPLVIEFARAILSRKTS